MSAARSGVRVDWELRGGAITLSASTCLSWGLPWVASEVRQDAAILSEALRRPIEVRSSRGVVLCTVDGRPS